ncbi:DNA alkylation repair protein [Amycolatopsis viridis]|uniref:3-methyladenine DNA glycosylase AlkD n=1 Tax=Amycolatopsis viridis TaxID=185678 RepID=A0ABX0SVU9_9PSEU|nr:DNA alkylation repair protein [Amycolatopsis viridis]NIH81087.1 3-methyladenine DNA glycosylase AlkD [Amycolatopsis viridis]
MNEVDELVQAARAGLAHLADPVKAPAMRRYMKSEMDFRGVPKPERSRLARRVFGEHPLPDRESFVAAVRELWRDAAFREERYLAIDLTGHRAYARWQDHTLIPLYEEMIVSGAWWDYVDEIAIRRVGPLLRTDRERVTPVVRRWARDADRWRRRTAVICQVGARDNTDTGLLTSVIEANEGDGDFFLRKGIGWALRDYARTAPDWVRAFVETHPALSPLSVREALKHLGS